MTNSELLQICGILPEDASEDVVELVRLAARLLKWAARRGLFSNKPSEVIGSDEPSEDVMGVEADGPAEAAVALAAALGKVPGWSVEPPFGFTGGRVEYEGWVRRADLLEVLLRLGMMTVGRRFTPAIANWAIDDAISDSWMQVRELPADTVPHNPRERESDLTGAVKAHPLGIARVRELANLAGLLPPPALAAKSRAKSKAKGRLQWLTQAMLQVHDHPDWSDAKIAQEVGVSPGTLSRSDTYKAAARLARDRKTNLPKGYVRTDPDSGLRDVEAAAPPAAPVDDRSDRGTRISSSRRARECCDECGETMRATKDKMGGKLLCDRCAR